MESHIIHQFKTLFETERNRILSQRKILNPILETESSDLADESDLTSSELEKNLRIRLLSRESQYLKKIDAALERIAQGSFHLCTECEEPIGLKRLQARPTATQCVSCKETQEHKERAFTQLIAI